MTELNASRLQEDILTLIWGTRGAFPVEANDRFRDQTFHKYGTGTSCVEMRMGNHILVFDLGSNAHKVAEYLPNKANVRLFYTHAHADHIAGSEGFATMLPFRGIEDLFNPESTNFLTLKNLMRTSGIKQKITVYDGKFTISEKNKKGRTSAEITMKKLLESPFSRKLFKHFNRFTQFKEFEPGVSIGIGKGSPIKVKTIRLDHPGGSVGYRVQYRGKVVSLITDTVLLPDLYDQVAKFIKGSDILIGDTFWRDNETNNLYPENALLKARNNDLLSRWAHSVSRIAKTEASHPSLEQMAKLALESGVKTFIPTHHANFRDDASNDQDFAAEQAKYADTLNIVPARPQVGMFSDGQVLEPVSLGQLLTSIQRASFR